jgi:hypothetical protein
MLALQELRPSGGGHGLFSPSARPPYNSAMSESPLTRLFDAPVVVQELVGTLPEPDALHRAEAECVRGAVRKRRREFAGGRLCARRALAELGIQTSRSCPGPAPEAVRRAGRPAS